MTALDAALVAVIVLQQAAAAWAARGAFAERQRLLNAAMSKTPQEFVQLEAADRPKRRKKTDDTERYIPVGL